MARRDPASARRTVGELLAEGRARLAGAPFRPPPREAALLLARVLGLSEAQLVARREATVATPQASRFESLLERRLTGEPVAYLLGEKEFFGRSFRVDRRVLVPRPETEHLVEAVLGLGLPPRPRILDVGTGSGAIAITLALELTGSRVVATDDSPAALALARRNARRLGARTAFLASDLGSALVVEGFDLVVSNPPYVDPDDASALSPEILLFEPHGALFAEGGGVAVVERLLTDLSPLRSGTPLLLEIGAGQAARLERLARGSPFDLLEIRVDYAGIPRVPLLRRR